MTSLKSVKRFNLETNLSDSIPANPFSILGIFSIILQSIFYHLQPRKSSFTTQPTNQPASIEANHSTSLIRDLKFDIKLLN